MTQGESDNATVLIRTPRCFCCGQDGTVALTADQNERYQNGRYIQDSLPELSDDLREQMISGTHGECWKQMFGAGDE